MTIKERIHNTLQPLLHEAHLLQQGQPPHPLPPHEGPPPPPPPPRAFHPPLPAHVYLAQALTHIAEELEALRQLIEDQHHRAQTQ